MVEYRFFSLQTDMKIDSKSQVARVEVKLQCLTKQTNKRFLVRIIGGQRLENLEYFNKDIETLLYFVAIYLFICHKLVASLLHIKVITIA